MKVKGIIDEDFVNYKVPSMMILSATCSFKCDIDCGMQVCQNSTLATMPNIEIGIHSLIYRYLHNNITKAIIWGGLEPLDQFQDVVEFLDALRHDYKCNDTVVIYTGYNSNEVDSEIIHLQEYPNVIVKFGRYIPNKSQHYDSILGVNLASPNQYAEIIS